LPHLSGGLAKGPRKILPAFPLFWGYKTRPKMAVTAAAATIAVAGGGAAGSREVRGVHGGRDVGDGALLALEGGGAGHEDVLHGLGVEGLLSVGAVRVAGVVAASTSSLMCGRVEQDCSMALGFGAVHGGLSSTVHGTRPSGPPTSRQIQHGPGSASATVPHAVSVGSLLRGTSVHGSASTTVPLRTAFAPRRGVASVHGSASTTVPLSRPLGTTITVAVPVGYYIGPGRAARRGRRRQRLKRLEVWYSDSTEGPRGD